MSPVVAASAGTTRAYASATSGGGASGAAHRRDHAVARLKQVEEHRLAGRLERAGGTGSGHPRAAALAPDDPSIVAQQVIGGDHGAAPDGQRRREGPVGGSGSPGGQLSLVDQPPQPRRKAPAGARGW